METANSNPSTLTATLTPTTTASPAGLKTLDKTLQGSVLVLIQFDVCEEIKLDALRDIFGARRILLRDTSGFSVLRLSSQSNRSFWKAASGSTCRSSITITEF